LEILIASWHLGVTFLLEGGRWLRKKEKSGEDHEAAPRRRKPAGWAPVGKAGEGAWLRSKAEKIENYPKDLGTQGSLVAVVSLGGERGKSQGSKGGRKLEDG
jgi:hypothetical protein